MRRFQTAGLYLVTSQALSAERTTPDIVKAALAGGVKLIQLREKDMPIREYVKLAHGIREMTARAGALLIINDRVDVALATKADGVHLGQDDFPVCEARNLGPDLIIGVSTHSIEEALRAQEDGASYINIGPIYQTGTKVWDGAFLGLDGLQAMASVTRIPFSVMGGIKMTHIPGLLRAGARTIALVTAVTGAPDPEAAARELLNMINAGSLPALPKGHFPETAG
ncbi:MAG: thiamine phosphate synthase [bacterium]